jgi:S-adenosylmethionine:tRNA ribosyltransferase-isomerase
MSGVAVAADGLQALIPAPVSPLSTELFDYHLPVELVAQTPAICRDQSRLLVVDRSTRAIRHHSFSEVGSFLRPGDTLFRNIAAVFPARLRARRPAGAHVECFLLRPLEAEHTWCCLVKPGRRLPVGAVFSHESKAFTGEIVKKEVDGSAVVHFTTKDDEPITVVANRLGDVPLPPYIARRNEDSAIRASQRALDLERYQTVYADRTRQVAVAAPTAGLHFTPGLLGSLADRGVRTADVTLHVGLGTFKPIVSDTIEGHAIHHELYEIPPGTQRALFPPLNGRRIAVGTTSVRTIEDFLSTHEAPVKGDRTFFGDAGIFIYPPRLFRGADALITNFHQPRSTLLCLVAAFLTPGSMEGIRWIREIYAEAIARKYRFFSYGDAMLII